MSLLSFFRRSVKPAAKRPTCKPQVEALEDRRLLSANGDDLPLPGPWVTLEGRQWSGQVANWHYYNNQHNYRSPSEFEATINWGDQTTSVGTVAYRDNTPGRGFIVLGDHVYRRWSNDQYEVQVTIRDRNPPPGENAVIYGRVGIYVAGQRPIVEAIPVHVPTPNVPWTGVVARVTLPNSDRIDSTLTARVWWGTEGTSPEDGRPVTIRPIGNNQFEVIATHTFRPQGGGENGLYHYQLIVDATTGQYNRGGRSEMVYLTVPVPVTAAPVPPITTYSTPRPSPTQPVHTPFVQQEHGRKRRKVKRRRAVGVRMRAVVRAETAPGSGEVSD